MKWFEYLIALGAIILVLLPIMLKLINKKIKKGCCNCSNCTKECPFKK